MLCYAIQPMGNLICMFGVLHINKYMMVDNYQGLPMRYQLNWHLSYFLFENYTIDLHASEIRCMQWSSAVKI